jgi:hypothetical protein
MFKKIIVFVILSFYSFVGNTQQTNDTTSFSGKMYIITKNDGTKFMGKIITSDPREVLLESTKIGLVYIPKHEIKSIKEITTSLSEKDFSEENIFATRYFITTNGFPIRKGDSYIQWNLYGPDFQFGIRDNFGIGIMTSWGGVPIIANAKYSIKLKDELHLGLGLLAGSGSWTFPQLGIGLPFTSLTYGNRKNNITASFGYGAITYRNSNGRYRLIDYSNDAMYTNSYTLENYQSTEGRLLTSVSGMFRLSNELSFVFDSFILLQGKDKEKQQLEQMYNQVTNQFTYYISKQNEDRPAIILLIPGLRWQTNADKAFQFGFAGLNFDREFQKVPIPFVQWYRKF